MADTKEKDTAEKLKSDIEVPAGLAEKAEGIARDLRLQRAQATKQGLEVVELEATGEIPGKTLQERVWDKAMTEAMEKVAAEDPTETDPRFAASELLVEAHEENKKFDAAAAKAAKEPVKEPVKATGKPTK